MRKTVHAFIDFKENRALVDVWGETVGIDTYIRYHATRNPYKLRTKERSVEVIVFYVDGHRAFLLGDNIV